MSSMTTNEHTLFTDLLEERYERTEPHLHTLNTRQLDDGRSVYRMFRVEQSGELPMVLFAAHDDLVNNRTFRWQSNQCVSDWLQQRAQLLLFLAEQAYPAPRVLPSLEGALMVRYQQWNLLLTTFIEGRTSLVTPENMSLLASTLGQLHHLSLSSFSPSASAWWNSSYSLPHALERLQSVQGDVPASYWGLYEQCRETLRTIQHLWLTLPQALIHGDCWAPNGVRLPDSQEVVLIDWEGAGKGPAILDLGSFLLHCQDDEHGALAETMNESRISAVVQGYSQWRIPSSPEIDLLLDAIRFRSAWIGAWMFSRLSQEEWTPRLEQGLGHIQQGYALAEPTARLARTLFAHKQALSNI